jgi:hypothetical protein
MLYTKDVVNRHLLFRGSIGLLPLNIRVGILIIQGEGTRQMLYAKDGSPCKLINVCYSNISGSVIEVMVQESKA